jgi:hypothetical protein
MRALHMIVVLLIVSLGSTSLGTCQTADSANDITGKHDSEFLAKPNQVTLDVSILAATLGYARSATRRNFFGVEAGIGIEWLSYTAVAGTIYKTEGLNEILHVAGFWRFQPWDFLQADTGFRASMFLHNWSGSSEACGFLGGYAGIYMGWRYVKLGSRVLVGVISGRVDHSETSVIIMPLTVRFTLPW